jgi:hypothetical protein
MLPGKVKTNRTKIMEENSWEQINITIPQFIHGSCFLSTCKRGGFSCGLEGKRK